MPLADDEFAVAVDLVTTYEKRSPQKISGSAKRAGRKPAADVATCAATCEYKPSREVDYTTTKTKTDTGRKKSPAPGSRRSPPPRTPKGRGGGNGSVRL